MAAAETDDDIAARWAIRLDANAIDAVEQRELDRWLTGATARAAKLLRAQAALSYLDRGRALADPEDDGSVESQCATNIRRRTFLAGGAAAAAAAVAGILAWPDHAETIDAGVGELRRLPLADGSMATLNTRTRVAIAMADRQRTVRLEDGEAWFRVAPDKRRPFVVEAGDIRVRAVGTAFSVRRRSGGADVLVTEGTIETWVVGHEADKRLITAGSRGYVPQTSAAIEVSRAPQEIDRALAWRSGELALDGERLAYAVSELNRYNVRQIVLADPALGEETLVGYFRTTEPESFARAVASLIGGKVVVEGDTIRIVPDKL